MARGRAFDSDASGSRSRGGRGPRCSARGRGGSIPPSSLASHASAPSAQPQPEHTPEEFTELWARVDDQQRQIAEFRAHVMRVSGEPGAGTSSSDPAPATDRNVSTSQQQPLPSPDPDAADDTLVTPPGTTAHPAGTPPGDLTLVVRMSNRVDLILDLFSFLVVF
ncbi:hypothetical protein JCGZ_15364 [Jatropha curcas]|uniref:Uncharacterized protein n=1 Tax=Jatropha curcas TaxID=180498 RepID=A0A067KHA6_JATCU|nr:hypothetical protein JCGZ_15364 [Jatropha curcas]